MAKKEHQEAEDQAQASTADIAPEPVPEPAGIAREHLVDTVRDLLLADPTILQEALSSLGLGQAESAGPVSAPLVTLTPPKPAGQIPVAGELVEIEVPAKRRVRCVQTQRFCRPGERAWVARADLLADPAMGIALEDPDAVRLPPPALE